jgi:hypothetical protein
MQVGEGHGLDLVVGDVDAGGAELLVLLADVDADLGAQGGVEVGEGLVEEEELRAADDGAAHGDALALAAGEGAGEAVEQEGPRPSMVATSSTRWSISAGSVLRSLRPKARLSRTLRWG